MSDDKKKKIVRIALYVRVSTEEQNLSNQIHILEDEVNRHKNEDEDEVWEIYETYSDKLSGANQSRPGLIKLLNDAKDKKFDLVLATKIDRIARSSLNLMKICNDLDKWGIGIKFVEQNFDMTTAEGKLLRNFLSAIAEFELELIHSRTKDGLARAKREGKTLGRPKSTLSEYQINKAKEIIEENPDISQRQLASQFLGIDRKQLIRELKARGIWTK